MIIYQFALVFFVLFNDYMRIIRRPSSASYIDE